jgi:hypothetical protein
VPSTGARSTYCSSFLPLDRRDLRHLLTHLRRHRDTGPRDVAVGRPEADRPGSGLDAGAQCRQPRYVGLCRKRVTGDMPAVGTVEGVVEFDQHVADRDMITVADMNGGDEAGLQRLDHLGVASRPHDTPIRQLLTGRERRHAAFQTRNSMPISQEARHPPGSLRHTSHLTPCEIPS